MNRIAGFTLVFSLVFPGLRLTSPGWLRAAVLTPVFLVLIQGGNCEAQAEVDSNSVVCVSSSGSVTTKALVGATLEDHMRLYTSRYAFDNFEKLLKQTETTRRMGQFSGTNLASLTASITRHLASLYDRKVNGEIALRLVEEFVLHRDPAPVWYYDQKTIGIAWTTIHICGRTKPDSGKRQQMDFRWKSSSGA